jgi:hypothetical protein
MKTYGAVGMWLHYSSSCSQLEWTGSQETGGPHSPSGRCGREEPHRALHRVLPTELAVISTASRIRRAARVGGVWFENQQKKEAEYSDFAKTVSFHILSDSSVVPPCDVLQSSDWRSPEQIRMENKWVHSHKEKKKKKKKKKATGKWPWRQ